MSFKVFTSEGKFLYSFGSKGEGNGQFNGPTGVAVDSMDNIIVADWGNSRLQVRQLGISQSNNNRLFLHGQVFDQFGSFLTFINTSGCKIYGPQGIAVTPEESVVLADSGNHCIKCFKYLS